jgi:hypothetical protein
MSLGPSVRPSAWNNSAPTVRIFIKFDPSTHPGATTHAGSWPTRVIASKHLYPWPWSSNFWLPTSLHPSLLHPSIHLRFGLPNRLLPSGLSKVIFLHGRLSCIRTICPAHLSLIILIDVTNQSLIIQKTQLFIISWSPRCLFTDRHEIWYLRIFRKFCLENSSFIKMRQE